MVHRQLLAEIAAGRIADDMSAVATELIHQLGNVLYQPLEREPMIPGGDWRAAVTAQIHPHDTVMTAERRDPRVIAPRAAHCCVQQQ